MAATLSPRGAKSTAGPRRCHRGAERGADPSVDHLRATPPCRASAPAWAHEEGHCRSRCRPEHGPVRAAGTRSRAPFGGHGGLGVGGPFCGVGAGSGTPYHFPACGMPGSRLHVEGRFEPAVQLEAAWGRARVARAHVARARCPVWAGWDAHHQWRSRGHNGSANLLLACVDCRENCEERGHVSREHLVRLLGREVLFKHRPRDSRATLVHVSREAADDALRRDAAACQRVGEVRRGYSRPFWTLVERAQRAYLVAPLRQLVGGGWRPAVSRTGCDFKAKKARACEVKAR